MIAGSLHPLHVAWTPSEEVAPKRSNWVSPGMYDYHTARPHVCESYYWRSNRCKTRLANCGLFARTPHLLRCRGHCHPRHPFGCPQTHDRRLSPHIRRPNDVGSCHLYCPGTNVLGDAEMANPAVSFARQPKTLHLTQQIHQ